MRAKTISIHQVPAVLCICGLAMAASPSPGPIVPKGEDRVETQLVQLDVVVDGKPEVVASLKAEDFSLDVGGIDITEFFADRVCGAPTASSGENGPPEGSAPSADAAPSFLLFFDQTHLTSLGRANGLQIARDLIDRFVNNGTSAAIVSSATRLVTVVPLTIDRARLLQGLDRLAGDPSQLDPSAQLEDIHVGEIRAALRRGDLAGARSLARQYANEEWRQARQSEQRLGLSLGLLTRVPPPRRAFYIGDTLRLDAGQHFLQMVPDAEDLGLEAAAEFEFDRLVRDALGLNVHLFPIQAEGMTPGPARTTQAEDTLISLGAETGGEGFIRGIPTSKIVARVHERYDCTYVLSFKPNGLPTDKIIAVHVGMVRKGVKVRSQGRVVIPSASQRKMTRILAAFAETGDDDPSSGFAVSLVFLSVEKRNYRALVQVRAPADPPGGTGWDLGASLIGRDSVRVDFSLHIAAAGRSVPVVLEKEVTLDPGAYEVVAVGQASGDRVLSSRIEGVLPKPDKDGFISPIAALQETTAAFSRDKITRISGPLVVPENEPVDDTKSIALVSVVCRDLGSSEEVIERKLAGDSPIRFDPVHFAPAERCVQLRDVIPANALTAGLFTYEIQLMRGEGVIQTGIHRIRVEPTSPPPPNRG